MEPDARYAVQMHGIVKTFGTFTALDHVDLTVERGSIHAVLGENGAGKSTLMNVLYGLYQADEGSIYLNGEQVTINNPNDAIAHGIGMVHQHFMLVDNFTVTQNIVLGSEVTRGAGVLDMKKARENVQQIISQYGLEVDPDAKIEDISVGMQQRVEILKALYRGADILILDEPTAVLTPQEIERLIAIMRDLAASGKTIIVITHKLKEIKASSDTCTIIRRGQYVDEVRVADVSEEQLADMMVGHHVNLQVEKTPAQPGAPVFEIRDLHVKDERGIETVKGLNLTVRKGEIVGLAGIDGNGQKELVEAITCLTKATGGKVLVNGEEIQNTTTRNVIDHKVSTIHEDRQKRGLVLPFTVQRTLCWRSTARRSSAPVACSIAPRCMSSPSSSSATTTSARRTALIKRPRACPAATSKRSSSHARYPTIPTCSLPSSPRAAWTWAPSSTCTKPWWPSATAAPRSCSSRWSSMRS